MNIPHKISMLVLSFILIMIFSGTIYCQDLKAYDIMKKVDARDDGDSSTSETVMILVDKKKQKRIRQLKNFRIDLGKDSKSLLFFRTPADVRNTSFLTFDWDDESKDDDTFLYLPALGKEKRIASGDKSKPFMGSDFSYSDMNGVEIEDWDYKFYKKKEATIDGHKTWIIEGTPKADRKDKVVKETGYIKTRMWVRQDIFMTVKGMIWVKKGKKIKYLEVKDIREVDGIWTAHEVQMTTTKRKRLQHATIIKTSKVEYNKALKEEMFTIQTMKGGL